MKILDRISLEARFITNKNWGFPWHVWLACLLYHFCFISLFALHKSFWASLFLSILIVNAVGYLYEKYQREAKPEMIGDMIANNIGILSAIITIGFYCLMKLILN
jgi:glucan phosphoethanolaminetransferase (alkaline phosphatase superfamily)